VNKEKRLQWAQKHLHEALTDNFKDVVWTDEASIQIETHRRFCYRKKGQRPKLISSGYTLDQNTQLRFMCGRGYLGMAQHP
jgi:hypothetical protein